jgi:HlyD family type I secretion membrane fusion protein
MVGRVRLLYDPGVVPLNQAIELEERAPSNAGTQLVFAICALVVLSVLWAVLTRVDSVANAHGRVVPAGDVVAVQHLEGGVIAKILVAEGEHVKVGQPLLRLAALDTEGRLGQWHAKRAAHLLAIEGQRAFIERRLPKFEGVVPGFENQKAEQSALYTARVQALETQRMVLTSQLEQRRSEVGRLSAQVKALSRDVESAESEVTMRGTLFEQKLTTRERLFNARRDASDRQKQYMNTRDQYGRTANEVIEFERKLKELDAGSQAEAQTAISQHTSDLAEVEAVLKNEQGREGRLTVKAPVSGIVMGLVAKSINAVVRPGDTLMEIVPTQEALVISADVVPQDIAQVTLGQRADVRVSAYDYATYGTLQGKVSRISATTFSDPEGRQFYKVRIQLDRDYFGANPHDARILPGMDVEVDVKTGSRSVFAYLVKPVSKVWNTALREP